MWQPMIIFSTMRSGSTLLMRLLNTACGMRMIGDPGSTVLTSIGCIWSEIQNVERARRGRQLHDFHEGEKLPFDYDPCPKENRERQLFNFFSSFCSEGTGFNCCFKTTEMFLIPDNEVHEKSFMEFIRWTQDKDKGQEIQWPKAPLRIVWLTRETSKIKQSIERSRHLFNPDPKKGDWSHALLQGAIEEMTEAQKEKFKQYADPSRDYFLTYEELILNPCAALEKLGLKFLKSLVDFEMQLKLR